MRKILLCSLVVMAAACGGDDGDSTGPDTPTVPNVAGTYAGNVTIDAQSSVGGTERIGAEGMTATVQQTDAQLNVGVVGQSGWGFTFTGTIAPGGAIALNPPNISAFAAGFPDCAFTQAVATNGGSITGGHMVVMAQITNAKCPWVQSNGALVATNFTIRIDGN